MANNKAAAPSGANRRELLRQQQEAELKKAQRQRSVVLGIGILVLAVIAFAIYWGVNTRAAQDKEAGLQGSSAVQVIPPSANQDTYAMALSPGKAQEGAPLLELWSDYQCPGCAAYDKVFGAILASLAESGQIRYEVHTLTFLDTNLRNTSSFDASRAASCADTVGAYPAYHDTIYVNQPVREGDGFTEEQLRSSFAANANITGEALTQFQACYDTKATSGWAKAMSEQPMAKFIQATPTYLVNGKKLELSTVNPTEADVLAAIQQTAASSAPVVSASAATPR